MPPVIRRGSSPKLLSYIPSFDDFRQGTSVGVVRKRTDRFRNLAQFGTIDVSIY
jgi:hypothetical protein